MGLPGLGPGEDPARRLGGEREQGTYLTAALKSLGERLPRCGNVDMPSILPPGYATVMCLLEALLAVHTGPDHVLLCPLIPPRPLVSFS